jgi:CRISPR-associated protein Cas6
VPRNLVTVDLSFNLRGSEIPVDHGYALYSAVSRVIPSLHGDLTAGIHPITGSLIGGRLLRLTESSRLVLRLPSERIHDAMPLSGKHLDIDGHPVVVGIPSPRMLRPAPGLRSRMVVIKGFLEADPFLEACRRQLAAIGVEGEASIPVRLLPQPLEQNDKNRMDEKRTPFIRRTLRIHDKTIVGYALHVSGLSSEHSIRLQEAGLGGRRRFGCGIFVPFEGGAKR